MAAANLTAASVRELFDYDPETGALTHAHSKKNNAVKAGADAGAVDSDGYWRTSIDGVSFRVHRLVWLHFHGSEPSGQIDHINGVRTDNRICNLRDVLPAVNSQNIRHAPAGKRSGLLLGVAATKRSARPYRSQIRINGRLTFLGEFITQEEAHCAYMEAKRRAHPGFTL